MIKVSVIIPCLNEEKTIYACLDGLCRQTFPKENMEVVIADGLSTDKTRDEIRRFMDTRPAFEVRLVDNVQKTIPSALNRAIEASRGEFIVRMDAHSRPAEEYISRSLENLNQNIADNVGGIWKIKPGTDTWIAESIAEAAAHRLGVGDARYRYTTKPGFVDTVPFGSFRKDLFDRIGKYNEHLLTNEDYEFNARILSSGGKIYLDPAIQCEYFARPTLRSLSRQYWRYGYWKSRMLRDYPSTMKARQLLPPLFVASLLLAGILAFWFAPFRWLLAAEILLYLLILCLASIPAARKGKDIRLIFGIPLAIASMHFSWGAGFLVSLFQGNSK